MRILSSMTLFCLILSSIPDDLQARRKQTSKNIKVGLQRWINSITYTYEARINEGKTDGKMKHFKVTSSGAMTDTALLLEYVVSQRIGIELGTGMTSAVRNFTLETDHQTVGEIKQLLKLNNYLGINAYFSPFTGNGIKPFAGIGISSFQVNSLLYQWWTDQNQCRFWNCK